MEINQFFNELWHDYVAITPQAAKIHEIFSDNNSQVQNDHVAFRTFNLSPISIESLEPLILALGYQHRDSYNFKEKKLLARSYISPEINQPLIFLSELEVEKLSDGVQRIIKNLCDDIDTARTQKPDVFWSGRLWDMISWDDYSVLLKESEYAAWLSALGFHANHFTVSVTHLDNDDTLEKVIHRVEGAGFSINSAGGKIKGSEKDLLIQASTMADRMTVSFANNEEHEISTCYYEFAKRFAQENGTLFQGFVPNSADKIFESTNVIK